MPGYIDKNSNIFKYAQAKTVGTLGFGDADYIVDSTNVRTQLNAALTASQTDGYKHIYIKAGDYPIESTSTSLNYKNLKIEGAGYASRLYDSTTDATDTIYENKGILHFLATTADIGNITIRDFYFEGKQDDTTFIGNRSGNGVLIRGNPVTGFYAEGCNVESCWFRDGWQGVNYKRVRASNLTNLHFDNFEHAIALSQCDGIQITGMYINIYTALGTRPGFCQRGLRIDYCKNVNVSNFTFKNISTAGILIRAYDDAATSDCTDINISNGEIDNTDTPTTDITNGVVIQTDVTYKIKRVKISKLNIKGDLSRGIFFDVDTNSIGGAVEGMVDDVVISKCTIECENNIAMRMRFAPATSGLYVYTNVTFRDCRFIGFDGVLAQYGKNIKFIDCHFESTGNAGNNAASFSEISNLTLIRCTADSATGNDFVFGAGLVNAKVRGCTAVNSAISVNSTSDISFESNEGFGIYNSNFGWEKLYGTATQISGSQFRLTGDYTSKIMKGTPIRYKEAAGTVFEYGYITAITYGAPNTTFTVTSGSDYSIASNPKDIWIGTGQTPAGFPDLFTYSTTVTAAGALTWTATPGSDDIAKFRIRGRVVTLFLLQTGTTGGVAATAIYATLPIAIDSTSNNHMTYAAYVDGGIRRLGHAIYATPNSGSIAIRKEDASNWGLGVNRVVEVHGINYTY